MKKLLAALVLFLMLAAGAAGLLARRAPSLVRDALGRALGKPVQIRDIRYTFPGTFVLEGFEVREVGAMAGETSFSAGTLEMTVSALSLSQRKLLVDRIEVSGAEVRVWKRSGRLYHPLSPEGQKPADAGATGGPERSADASRDLTLEIGEFRLEGGRFTFADYDIDPRGFVTVVEGLDARVRRIRVPAGEAPTSYEVTGRLSQGRDVPPARLAARGWTRFSDLDSDASFELNGVSLPYFRPYYAQVTPAAILEGTLDARALVKVSDKRLTGDAQLAIGGLHFDAYEQGGELFGLRADEVLGFLKDQSGRLNFPIAFEWTIGSSGVIAREELRRSIAKSLQRTVLGNVGNVLSRAIRRYGEVESEEAPDRRKPKDDLQDAIQKVKNYIEERT